MNKSRKLKIFNGRDWNAKGHLYICAYSIKDCAELSSQAYRKVENLEDRPDIQMSSVSEVNRYWSKGCWGNKMDELVPVPERGVWWTPCEYGPNKKPIQRII